MRNSGWRMAIRFALVWKEIVRGVTFNHVVFGTGWSGSCDRFPVINVVARLLLRKLGSIAEGVSSQELSNWRPWRYADDFMIISFCILIQVSQKFISRGPAGIMLSLLPSYYMVPLLELWLTTPSMHTCINMPLLAKTTITLPLNL